MADQNGAEDSFGMGIDMGDASGSGSPGESPKPRRRTRKPKPSDGPARSSDRSSESVGVESPVSSAPVAASPRHESTSNASASASDESGGGSGGGAVSSGSGSSGEGGLNDDGRNKKRRRRRRRKGPGEGTTFHAPHQHQGGGGGSTGGPRHQPRNQNQRRDFGRRRGPGQGGQGGQGGHQPSNFGGNSQSYRSRPQRDPNPPAAMEPGSVESMEGVLELHPKGYGFLRSADKDYASQETDPFVSGSIVEKYRLREGVRIRGDVGAGTRGQGPRLRSVESVDGRTVEEYQQIKSFEELTPINPFEQIRLERGPEPVTMRVMDLLTPIGRGQRALIVAPPRTGKTMLLQDIANSVSKNHPDIHLIVLLIDERPEEVTEMRRVVNGEVIASSMDRDVESHVRTSQLIIERGKRIAEAGGHAFILLDSITRTARAFNKWTGNTGRTMTGGLDVKAMDIPKKMFGTARRFDEGGSLTVVGTALIDTGSRMDEVIFQEFKGTGNMEMVLSRDLADRRIWPSIDISRSGTRREEKILAPDVLEGVTMLRRSLISLNPVEGMEQLTRVLAKYPSNAEFLQKIKHVL